MKIILSNNKNFLIGISGKAGEISKYLKENKNNK